MPTDDENISEYKNKKIRVVGIVDSEPDDTLAGKKFNLRITNIFRNIDTGHHAENESRKFEKPSLILVKSNSFDSRIRYGTQIEAVLKLEVPEIIEGDDGRVFDYPKYLAKSGIFYISKRADVRIVSEDKGNRLLKYLYFTKHSFMLMVDRKLPAPESFLANGLVISGKGSMSKELQLEFQKVGLIHIVVLSGSNISIIGEAIVRAFSFLPTFWSSLFGGLGIILFSCMTGGGATVVRSAIMSIIALTAKVTNRQNDALVSLMVAGSLMLVGNPYLLFYDPSFQLSFAASLGLILYSPRVSSTMTFLSLIGQKKVPLLSKIFVSVPNGVKKFFLEIVSSSLATQLSTLPLILNMSGMVSLASLPVNILLLPLIPYTMLSVFILGVSSFISEALSGLFTFVSWLLLKTILFSVHFVSSMQYSSLQFQPITSKVSVCLYVCMCIELVTHYSRKNRSRAEKPVFLQSFDSKS